MTTALVLALLLPQLQAQPYPCEAGQQAVLTATERGAPLQGVEVVVEDPAGGSTVLGPTDAAGQVRFAPPSEGVYRFVVQRDQARWVAPLQVVAQPRRFLYAAVCGPLGLLLLWRALRRQGQPRPQ